MAIESLEKRKRKLAELRDRDGNPIDQRALTHAKFLTASNTTSGTTLEKSRMDEPDRRAKRLATACEKMAALMADARPSLSKSSQATFRTREQELLTAARKLRSRR